MADDATSCSACGEAIESDASLGAPSVRIAAPRVVYAGFWLRVVAYTIDSLLLGVVLGIVLLRPLMEHAGISSDNPWVLFNGDSRQVVAINLMVMMAGWLYWAVLESSSWQATLGKKAIGLKVTDLPRPSRQPCARIGPAFRKNYFCWIYPCRDSLKRNRPCTT